MKSLSEHDGGYDDWDGVTDYYPVLSKEKRQDLGRILLQRRCLYRETLSQEDVGAWWGVTRQRIQQLEKLAMKKVRIRLREITDGDGTWRDLLTDFFNLDRKDIP